MRDHEVFMRRAVELAKRGVGWCSPNPPVGAVVVADGEIVGEGFHERAGEAHAETVALRSAGARAAGACLYVTLEPCNHVGRTPPCTDAIIEAGIRRVVVGTRDPNPHVKGGGVERLQSAGVEVAIGVAEPEARELIRAFAHHTATGRPYVHAKFGASVDGRISTRTGDSRWITGEASRSRGHRLRHEVDAIVVGVGTVLADDPLLTARLDRPASNPTPIVLDSAGRIPMGSRLVHAAPDNGLIVATTARIAGEKRTALERSGVEILVVRADAADPSGRVDLADLLSVLGRRAVQSVLVEGGSAVLGSFFDARLVDEVWAFLAPTIIGGVGATAAVGGLGLDGLPEVPRFERRSIEAIDEDVLIHLRACSPA